MINIGLLEAQRIAKKRGIDVSTVTLTKWVRDNSLGVQPGGTGGRWYINKLKFISFLEGNNANKKNDN